MKPRITAITLAVRDLEASLRFYRALGWSSDGIVGTEFEGTGSEPAGAVAMFSLENELVLSLYPEEQLAVDAGVDASAVAGHGFSLGHSVDSAAEVDDVLATAAAAGGVVTSVGTRPWGLYSGYFSDPDGHLWEVMHFQD